MVRQTLAVVMLLCFAACADQTPTVVSTDVMDHTARAAASRGRGDLGPEALADLAQVRQSTAGFHDVDVAAAAGYSVWSPDPFAPNATCPSSVRATWATIA